MAIGMKLIFRFEKLIKEICGVNATIPKEIFPLFDKIIVRIKEIFTRVLG